MNRERFRFFHVIHHESDLLVGVPHQGFHSSMEHCIKNELIRLRQILIDYSKKDPLFFTSLDPLDIYIPPLETDSPTGREEAQEIVMMLSCGHKTGTGPMAAVAGLFAQEVGRSMTESFGLKEVVVENGGDLYLRNETDLVSVIHAGDSVLSDKMAFVVPPGEWGICTSSGKMGHSYSRGLADAVTVISHSAPLADSWATAIANLVNNPADIEQALDSVAGVEEIQGVAIIIGDRVGIRGNIEVKLLP